MNVIHSLQRMSASYYEWNPIAMSHPSKEGDRFESEERERTAREDEACVPPPIRRRADRRGLLLTLDPPSSIPSLHSSSPAPRPVSCGCSERRGTSAGEGESWHGHALLRHGRPGPDIPTDNRDKDNYHPALRNTSSSMILSLSLFPRSHST